MVLILNKIFVEMWWLIVEMWWLIVERWWLSAVAHQTSEAKVPGSNPESPIMILMRCRIIMKKWRKSQGRGGNLLLRQKYRDIQK